MAAVKASNEKLYERAVSIMARATGADSAVARKTPEKCGFSCKTAVIMLFCKLTAEETATAIDAAGG